MVSRRFEGYRRTLLTLGRAAGLSSLALGTLASGPCGGDCSSEDECVTLEELVTQRDEGLAEPANLSSATDVELARAWDGESCPTPEQYRAIDQLKTRGLYSSDKLSALHSSSGKCCYRIEQSCSAGGRPFLVDGRARLATASSEAGEAAWLDDALMEHASIAAFARLSLQLLALGAPVELVRDAQRASLDELRHADFFFDLASREAGSQLRPGPLAVAGALDDLSLAGLVESNLLEGCIGETLAAEQLRAKALLLEDPELQTALLGIVADEEGHAALAFRILAWCREIAPQLTREVVQRVLAASASRVSPQRSRTERETWQHVLSPLLSAMA